MCCSSAAVLVAVVLKRKKGKLKKRIFKGYTLASMANPVIYGKLLQEFPFDEEED